LGVAAGEKSVSLARVATDLHLISEMFEALGSLLYDRWLQRRRSRGYKSDGIPVDQTRGFAERGNSTWANDLHTQEIVRVTRFVGKARSRRALN
jgi:hypothetical protein